MSTPEVVLSPDQRAAILHRCAGTKMETAADLLSGYGPAPSEPVTLDGLRRVATRRYPTAPAAAREHLAVLALRLCVEQWELDSAESPVNDPAPGSEGEPVPNTWQVYGRRGPLGFRPHPSARGCLLPVPEELATVARILHRVAEGATFRRVAAELIADRVPCHTGFPWRGEVVATVWRHRDKYLPHLPADVAGEVNRPPAPRNTPGRDYPGYLRRRGPSYRWSLVHEGTAYSATIRNPGLGEEDFRVYAEQRARELARMSPPAAGVERRTYKRRTAQAPPSWAPQASAPARPTPEAPGPIIPGTRNGGGRYGFVPHPSGTGLALHPAEMETVARVFLRIVAGASPATVAAELNADRIPARGRGVHYPRWFGSLVDRLWTDRSRYAPHLDPQVRQAIEAATSAPTT